ncbi:MAG: aminopeptidase P N-terminal domain-containing protein, partial [Bacteroidota bacterium]|nr:aminopeptidase P N-terminal domain-containing protein [Bacteroidota bacterium]
MHSTFPKRILFFALTLLLTGFAFAQPARPDAEDNDLPKDYLPASFHAGRRVALRQMMPANSVFVVFAYPTRNFSNDVDYFYHANPDMYYFSGYKEPHSLLLIFKDEQTDSAGNKYVELLFVQKRDAQAEQWTGRRMGTEGVKERLGIPMAFNGEDFKSFPIDFSKFDKIIFDRFPADVPNERDNADLLHLIQQFKEKAAIPEDYSKDKKFDTRSYREFTGRLREIKMPEEMNLLRKAVEISCVG